MKKNLLISISFVLYYSPIWDSKKILFSEHLDEQLSIWSVNDNPTIERDKISVKENWAEQQTNALC